MADFAEYSALFSPIPPNASVCSEARAWAERFATPAASGVRPKSGLYDSLLGYLENVPYRPDLMGT